MGGTVIKRLLIVLMIAAAMANSSSWAQEKAETNTGQDPTKPLTRLDLRYQIRMVVGSVEFGIPLVDDYPVYDFKVEFRVGFFF
jgi:hypothetical protein